MDANKFIDILESSDNKLLHGAAKDIMDWSKLRHDKESLELFLKYNIAVVYVEDMGEFLVSSNVQYLYYINNQRVQKTKNKVVKMMSSSTRFAKLLKSSQNGLVRTWDLIGNTKCEIPMTALWAVRRWIGIDRENIQALAIATDEILSKSKR